MLLGLIGKKVGKGKGKERWEKVGKRQGVGRGKKY